MDSIPLGLRQHLDRGVWRRLYRRQGLSKDDSIDRVGFEIVMDTKTRKEPRPKRTKSSAGTVAGPALDPSATPGAQIPLPTADALALIAANVSKGIDLEPRLAVDYAFKLWKNAREKLEGEIKEQAQVDNGNIPKSDGGGLPPAFPESAAPASKPVESTPPASQPVAGPVPSPKTSLPTFDTFLRTVVKGESDADSEKRFRAFLRSKFPEPEADELMAKLSKEGFKNVSSWLETTREYRDWCKLEKPTEPASP
jgi:hypothetical protein